MRWPDLGAHPGPLCRVLVDGRDITSTLMPRLVSLQLTDNRGLEADQLDVTLSDHDGALVIPPHGARLHCGWAGATAASSTKVCTWSTRPNTAARRTC